MESPFRPINTIEAGRVAPTTVSRKKKSLSKPILLRDIQWLHISIIGAEIVCFKYSKIKITTHLSSQ